MADIGEEAFLGKIRHDISIYCNASGRKTGEAVKRLSTPRYTPELSPPPSPLAHPGRHGKAGRTGQEWGGVFLPELGKQGVLAGHLGQIPSLPTGPAKPHFSPGPPGPSGEAAIAITRTVIAVTGVTAGPCGRHLPAPWPCGAVPVCELGFGRWASPPPAQPCQH